MCREGQPACDRPTCRAMQQGGASQEAQPALTRTHTAAASQPVSDADGSRPGALSLSCRGSDAVDLAVAVLAEACGGGQPLQDCCKPGAGCSLQAAASAEAQALASGNAAGMAAVLSAYRQLAAGRDSAGASAPQAHSNACEVQHNLRACSGVLGSAAKSACEASTKASPTGALAWQIAILDVMPLGPTALDYKFTARGQLPEGVQQSKLATAFGPEYAEDGGEDTSGKVARVQIGDALVALLESHRSHRYNVASADPEQVIKMLGALPEGAGDRVEIDRRARSLTRSLTRSAASSPLVQLLATHRKRREDLTGWQDETSCSSDDEIPRVRLSSALAEHAASAAAGGLMQAENALSLKPLLTSGDRTGSDGLPPLPPALACEAPATSECPPGHAGQCAPCPGSPREPPLPPSSCSSVDGRSSMSSYRSARASSVFSRASCDEQIVDWVTATSGTPMQHSRSSLDGPSSRRRSSDGWSFFEGRASFEGRPPLPMKRADTVESISSIPTVMEVPKTGVMDGQCPGCGSMTECCCKAMELGSHPDLESVPEDDLASVSEAGAPAPPEASASLRTSLGGERDSIKYCQNLRLMLRKQLPAGGADACQQGESTQQLDISRENSGGSARLRALRCASFSEVLESCMRCNSSSASQTSLGPQMTPTQELPEPFIPMPSASGSVEGSDDRGQQLGTTRAWSFDDRLARQHLQRMRPGGHSLDAGAKDKSRDQSSYAELMAEYRTRMGMDKSSRTSSLKMAENPSASMNVSGALRQAFRSQLHTPACSPPSFESPLLNGQYRALGSVSELSAASAPTAAGDAWEKRLTEMKMHAQNNKRSPAEQSAFRAAAAEAMKAAMFQAWPSSGMDGAISSGTESSEGPSGQHLEASRGPALAPRDAVMAASLAFKCAPAKADAKASAPPSVPHSGKPPTSPRQSLDSSVLRGVSPAGSYTALTAAAPGSLPVRGAPSARQSCARVRASLELRRRSADAGVPSRPSYDQPPICFPVLPTSASLVQLPITFLKSSQSQRPSLEADSGRSKDTSSVLAAVAAQLGQRAASLPLAAPQDHPVSDRPSMSSRRSSQLFRQLPTLEEGSPEAPCGARELAMLDEASSDEASLDVPCGARELSLNLGVPNLREQVSSDTTPPPDASHEPPDVSTPPMEEPASASGSTAACRLAALQQLFFAGAKPARKRMPTATGMLAADNISFGLPQPPASSGLRPLQLSVPVSTSDRDTLLQRVPRPSSPGTPPAVTEATPFSEMLPERPATPSPTSFIMQGLSEGVLHSAPGHAYAPHPMSMPMTCSPSYRSPSPGFHGVAIGPGSPSRSTTGSHELEDTYGAYRLRSDPPVILGGGSGLRHTVGSVAPSSLWLEHRAAAHHTAAGSMRGHVSMDETRLQCSSWLMPPIAFSSAGNSAPLEMLSEDAECLSTARRDNYVARTFSHMARARLDHAVSRSADAELLESEKWEMRFADDGPCTLSQSGASEEGAISKAKRMMAEAATAQASIFLRGEGTDQRDVDGTCCLLDTLAAPTVSKKCQQDILSTLAFLTSGSEINAGSVVASRGMATLVPLLGRRSEATVAGAVRVISNLLVSPAGQDAFVEENGLQVLSSLLSTSKAPAVLEAGLHCLGVFVRYACTPGGGGLPEASLLGSLGQPGLAGREAGNVLLLERSRAVPGAVRLAAAHECAEFSDTAARSVSSAALDLLLKVAAVPEMRTSLRTAGLMSALASVMTPSGADTAALLEPAMQLVAALASDAAAAVEFTAGGGVLGLLAILSDSSVKDSLAMHAATVMGVLVNCRRVRGAIWAAGGGSVLLPPITTASPPALTGLLYLLSCLAKYDDMRAELEAAGAVDVLLELLGSRHDTKVQAATLSLLRILTKAGKTLCAIPEHQSSAFEAASFVPERASLGNNSSAQKRRSLDGPPRPEALASSGRSQSLCLF